MMDEITIASQTLTLGQALLTGAAMGIYYDFFRILRRIFHPHYATIVAQDVFFWMTSAVGVFFAVTWFSGGVVRGYFLIAVLLGFGAYILTVGSIVMRIVDAILRSAKRIVSDIRRKISKKAQDRRKRVEALQKNQKNDEKDANTA